MSRQLPTWRPLAAALALLLCACPTSYADSDAQQRQVHAFANADLSLTLSPWPMAYASAAQFCSFAEDSAQLAPAAALSAPALTWLTAELSRHGCSGPTHVWLGRYTRPATTATTTHNGPLPCAASQGGLDTATLAAASEGQCLAAALVLDLNSSGEAAEAACWAVYPCDGLPSAAAPFLCAAAPSGSAVQQAGKGVNLTDLASQTQITGQVGIAQLLAQSPPPPSVAAGKTAAGDGGAGAEAECDVGKEEGCGWKAGEPFLGFYALSGGRIQVGGPPPPRAPPRSLAAPPAKPNKFAGWNLVIIIAVSAGGAVLLVAAVALTVVCWPRGEKQGAKAAAAAGADPTGAGAGHTGPVPAAEEGSPSSSTPETSSPHSSVLVLRPAPPPASLPGSPRSRGQRVRLAAAEPSPLAFSSLAEGADPNVVRPWTPRTPQTPRSA